MKINRFVPFDTGIFYRGLVVYRYYQLPYFFTDLPFVELMTTLDLFQNLQFKTWYIGFSYSIKHLM